MRETPPLRYVVLSLIFPTVTVLSVNGVGHESPSIKFRKLKYKNEINSRKPLKLFQLFVNW